MNNMNPLDSLRIQENILNNEAESIELPVQTRPKKSRNTQVQSTIPAQTYSSRSIKPKGKKPAFSQKHSFDVYSSQRQR